jgi:hypothetical protein
MHCVSVAIVASIPALPGSSVEAQAEIRHPTDANLRARDGDVSVSLRDTIARDSRLRAWREALALARRADSVGSLDGDVDEAFGTIVDLDVNAGRVAVLDRSQMRVVLLDRELAVVGAVGRQGSGPAEFRSPVGVSFEGDTLRVYDAVLGHKRFALPAQSPAGARLISVAPPVVAVQGVCFRTGGTYALAPSSLQPGRERSGDVEPLVSVLGADGRVTRTFGDSYRSPSALVRRVMSEGAIGCDARGRALIGLVKLPFVTAYSEDGRELRRLRLKDFVVSSSLERPNSRGQMSIGLDPETQGMSALSRIVHLDGDIFAIQVSRFQLARDRRSFPEVEVQTYLLNVTTFEAVAVGTQLPRIGKVDDSYLYAFANDPFPRVIRFRLHGTAQPHGGARPTVDGSPHCQTCLCDQP